MKISPHANSSHWENDRIYFLLTITHLYAYTDERNVWQDVNAAHLNDDVEEWENINASIPPQPCNHTCHHHTSPKIPPFLHHSTTDAEIQYSGYSSASEWKTSLSARRQTGAPNEVGIYQNLRYFDSNSTRHVDLERTNAWNFPSYVLTRHNSHVFFNQPEGH